MSASARIRASIEALPEELRRSWQAEPGNSIGAGEAWVASASLWPHSPKVAAYIALMDPHVGQAVADLLDARTAYEVLRDKHEAARQNWDEYRTDKALAQRIREREVAEDAIFAALDALEAAIEGEQR